MERGRSPSKRLQATAYHEAGHAVVACALRRNLHRVTIVADDDDDSLGACHYGIGARIQPEWESDTQVRRVIERDVLTSLAGMMAERRFTGRMNRQGADSDRMKAAWAASYLYDGEVLDAYLRFMLLRVDSMVAVPMNWHAIEAVAAALLNNGSLSGRTTRRIIRDSGRSAPPRVGRNLRLFEGKG